MSIAAGALRFSKANSYIVIGGFLVLITVLAAASAPLLTSYKPDSIAPSHRLEPPSRSHPLGTDEFGRDVLSRIVYGARNTMQIAFFAVVVTVTLGVTTGLLMGYFNRASAVTGSILDALIAFPEIIIAISLAAIWGPGKLSIISAMGFASFTRMARVVRSSTVYIKEIEFVEAARSTGAKDAYLIFRCILPNILSPIIVQATFVFAYSIIVESSLSFLGVGIKPPNPTWGGMLSTGRNVMAVAPWLVLFPGGAIVLATLGFNLLGDGLRDLLDPRLARR